MTEFTTLLQQGNAWFFIPSAILLGALHGLEPGHSKTMMAAFIIAIKGTISRYYALSVTKEYLALRGGPRSFPQGFTCLVVLWILPCSLAFRVRGFHPLWLAFPKPFY